MKELFTDIEILASADRVWQVLTDFTAYPQWNPFILHVEGEAKEGARLAVDLRPPGGKPMRFRPIVLRAVPNRELRWLGHFLIPGLFDGEHIFTIEPLRAARVRFIQREIVKGLLVPLFTRLLEENTRRGFEEMNRALKARAER